MRAAFALAALTAACSGGGDRLFVDARTDLAPGAEVDTLAARVVSPEGTPPQSIEVAPGVDAIEGLRVATFDGLRGDTTLIVEASRDGEIVLARPVRVDVRGRTGVTVTLSRDCRSAVCPSDGGDPAHTACVGGRCVDPGCTEEAPDACGAECASASECVAGSACAIGRCQAGVCLFAPRAAACADAQYCDPDLGCLPVPAGAPAALRQISPLAGARMSSRSPRLRVAAPPDATQIAIDLCADPGCADVRATLPAIDGTTPTEPDVLAGRDIWFWRARATVRGEERASVTWSFELPPTGPVEGTRCGYRFDANGDGAADLVVGWPKAPAGQVVVYGAESGSWVESAVSASSIEGAASYGAAVGGGDMDGDGRGDVLGGAPDEGEVTLLLAAGARRFSVTVGALPGLGGVVRFVGDIDGDGYGDAVALDATDARWVAVAIRGSPTASFAISRERFVAPPELASTRPVVASAGDVDADGFDDFVVGAPDAEGTGRLVLFRGGGDDPFRRRTVIDSGATASIGERFGASVAAGDVDGDGRCDLVAGAPGREPGAALFLVGDGRGSFAPSVALLPGGVVAAGEHVIALDVDDADGDELLTGDASEWREGRFVAWARFGLPSAGRLLLRGATGAPERLTAIGPIDGVRWLAASEADALHLVGVRDGMVAAGALLEGGPGFGASAR